MAPELLVRVREVLAEAARLLRDAGVVEPRREAVRIWSWLERVPAAAVPPDDGAAISPERSAKFLGAVARRAAGEPLAHVTGWAGFRHLSLRSDARALIPRPETEGLVDLLLARTRAGRVADIGTGTGCIALSLALEGAFDQVLGIDLSPEALALAVENRQEAGAPVALVRSDLTLCLEARSLDALVSNPPYLTAAEYGALDRSVREWEPELALSGGRDGLETIERLLVEARRVLRHRAWLALEVDESRAGQCAARAGALGYTEVAVHTDLFGRERFLLARRSDAE
jgi:release factor glutamine methyltransferase